MDVSSNPSALSTSEKRCMAFVGIIGLVSLVIGIIAIAESQTAPYEGLGTWGGGCITFAGAALIIGALIYYKCKSSPTSRPPPGADINLKEIENEVIHLGQVHKLKGIDSGVDADEKVFRSQHDLARYLLVHDIREVFVEGCNQTQTQDDITAEMINTRARIFPNGLPNLINEYTELQKKFLLDMSAPGLLLFLGKMDIIHPATSDKEDLYAWCTQEMLNGKSPYDPTLRPFVMDEREQKLLVEIRRVLATTKEKNKKIAIVYGALHNFERYFNTNNFKYFDFHGHEDSCVEIEEIIRNKAIIKISKEPNDIEARLTIARIAIKRRNYNEVFTQVAFILKLDPTHESALKLQKKAIHFNRKG